ncbi:NADH-quinone oxidoreductase subunit NuoN [Isoptericola sp. NEAU-Y5]|uniref:NADH-quinone oxidoreductase subunit N n=1 Tax=Isoptericola luteus TaxID=2879484 RepID=A0ABS7ZJ60_9MICO|nr:NADH-quinone oxidoreductase subunit NuoN [Isoptericola sp. NEAU-Y5]MCA5895052.1 NADH-quinone oxidoreductase subunit NuoN [Isoptericola sp. NEAU-Y5]
MNDFVAPTIDWAAVSPVLVVLGAGVLGVLLEAFVPARARRTTQITLTLAALVASLVAVGLLWERVSEGAVSVVGGSYLLTPFGLGIQAVIAISALLGVLVIADRTTTGQDSFAPAAAAVPGTTYEDEARRAGLQQTEIYPLLLFSTGGMLLFPATDDLIVMFVALEVLSLPLYVLCATARRRRLLSQEAAFKYFVLGAFASALFVFGVALVYGFAGTVRLQGVVQVLADPGTSPLGTMRGLVVVGLLLVLSGLLFKIGAAPFHTWTPDVYQGAPTPITGFMAACTKTAAVGALVRVLFTLAHGLDADTRHDVQVALWVVAILTMVIGSVVGAVQTDVKRLLAYSSIAHAGFVLVGVVGLDEVGSSAVVFYLLAYGLATIGAFAVVTLVRERTVSSDDRAGALGDTTDDGVVLGEATALAQWAGLGRRAPWLTAAFSLFLLSMAGIPLTAGFIAKFGVFSAAVEAGAWPLALLGVLGSAVSVFFYVRIIVFMVLTPPSDDEPGAVVEAAEDAGSVTGPAGGAPALTGTATRAVVARTVVTVVGSRGPAAVAIALCAVGVLLLGILPAGALDLAGQAAQFRP